MTAQKIIVDQEHAGKRLDVFVAGQVSEISRVRVQQLIAQQQVRVNGVQGKRSLRLSEGDEVEIRGEIKLPPVKAIAEEIPLEIVYEDDDLAVVNKPAGMMAHAGAGASDDARNRGTLVNALLHHFKNLSGVSGELRPGIVHRLDRQTSGLMIVAKNDFAHRKLAEQFSAREVKKTYIALVQGWPKQERGKIEAAIGRDRVRRVRMSTRTSAGRAAVSNYRVTERLETPWGKFALLEVQIETGRTHQIRVHMASLGHPVVGDTLYGAARELKIRPGGESAAAQAPLGRNFLHAARIEFVHPRSGNVMKFESELPVELREFLERLRQSRRDLEKDTH